MAAPSLVAVQDRFMATLSAVEDVLRFAFRRHLRPHGLRGGAGRGEGHRQGGAWVGLVKQGEAPGAVGGHGIAHDAIRHTRRGGRGARAGRRTSTTARRRRPAGSRSPAGTPATTSAPGIRPRGSWRARLAWSTRSPRPPRRAPGRTRRAVWRAGRPGGAGWRGYWPGGRDQHAGRGGRHLAGAGRPTPGRAGSELGGVQGRAGLGATIG